MECIMQGVEKQGQPMKCEDCLYYRKWKYSSDDCKAVILRVGNRERKRTTYGDPAIINQHNQCKKGERRIVTKKKYLDGMYVK